ncbi:transcriptional regulator, LytTR family [Pseudobutyrivibrio sp. AR14]|uniref:LytTR family transcriptional regulator n=2 Tax=Lachnospiraceae TaxID=186803 RepID=A0A2G3E8G4_9FIRM|nr:LytTR family DNA-binding domain-containing protein [Pseudobutyrivibrio ruminis]PHU34635.1 LytTR family transcriptional regulator [Pseudobutyrivibrio ruminis]PHU39527.1 LytTR family transcriptional regulator [Pseudobutyrivibrio ruminis]SCY34849.1 transcriptional regulator, LytTR family [Pseudobutyrivibrio sp. AR14]
MQLTMKNRQDIENPAVTIEYRELTENVKRVCDFVRGIDKTILCKKEGQSYSISAGDIYYIESVDKKTFIYDKSDVYQTNLRLIELDEMLSNVGFVRVSKSTILNVETLSSVKNLANSKLEAVLTNGERICVSRKYLKDIREVLIRRNR